MLNDLPSYAPDPIIALMQTFMADARTDKIDLGVGVYKDPDGKTPIFRAVKAAEARILETQTTKGYLPLSGDPVFHAAARTLVFGADAQVDRIATVATPGGSSALRQLLDLIAKVRPNAKVWISDPTWPNHAGLAGAARLTPVNYRYYDAGTGTVDWDAMMGDLAGIGPDDVVILHAAAHNPTGADLTPEQWSALGDLFERTGAMPLVDVAYQGFAVGVQEDAAGLRHLASRLPNMLVALSGSKSFGLYRDRAAAAFVLSETPALREVVQGNLTGLNRLNFAFPPDHGTRVMTEILNDADLHADWEAELSSMRTRLHANRLMLARALRETLQTDRFDALERQRGMFSILGFDDGLLERLRADHGLYLVKQGRINLAGLTEGNTPLVARAIAAELR